MFLKQTFQNSMRIDTFVYYQRIYWEIEAHCNANHCWDDIFRKIGTLTRFFKRTSYVVVNDRLGPSTCSLEKLLLQLYWQQKLYRDHRPGTINLLDSTAWLLNCGNCDANYLYCIFCAKQSGEPADGPDC